MTEFVREGDPRDWRAENAVTDWEAAKIGELLCDHDPRDLALMVVRMQGQADMTIERLQTENANLRKGMDKVREKGLAWQRACSEAVKKLNSEALS